MNKKKYFIYSAGYYGRQLYRKLKNEFYITAFLDQKKTSKKIFNKKIILPKKLEKYDHVYFSGFTKKKYLSVIKKWKLKIKKTTLINTSSVKTTGINLKNREKKIKIIFSKLIKLFNSKDFDYFINSSSLLAIIRKDSFAYYSDIDIEILEKDFLVLKKILKKKKIFSHVVINNDQIVIQSGKNDNKEYEPAILDIMPFKRLNKKILFSREHLRKKSIKLDLVYKTKTFRYNGIKVKIPHDIKRYLSKIYGKNFNVRPVNWGKY